MIKQILNQLKNWENKYHLLKVLLFEHRKNFSIRLNQPHSKNNSVKLPTISRLIPDGKWLSILLGICIFLFAITSILGSQLYTLGQERKVLEQERQQIFVKINHWEKVVGKYSDYRDGYFQLALLYFQLKNTEKAKHYLSKALELDPNFEEGRKFEKILVEKSQAQNSK